MSTTEILEDEPEVSLKKKNNIFSKFKSLFEDKKPKRVAIFSHSNPDPDAIASTWALKWVLSKLEIESDIFYSGSISHPQNKAMVNLLAPEYKWIDTYDPAEYDFNAVLDTVPVNAGVKTALKFDLVIDHHREIPNGGFDGLFINLKAGSASATVYAIIEKLGLEFDDESDQDIALATALMVGITTDTENLMADDTTEYEFNAWSKLFPLRNALALKKIVNYERPKVWVEAKSAFMSKTKVEDGIGILGMGMISSTHRDMISDMADEVVKWEDVNTAIVFAIVDGNRIEGSVRTKTASVSVPNLCHALGGKHGSGGGKLAKGAYRYDLAGASIDEDEDDQTKENAWNLFNDKETKRVLKILRDK